MDNILADVNVEDPTAAVDRDTEMADVAPRAIQKQAKQEKDKKKEKKEKKEKKGKKEKKEKKEKKLKREEGGETRKKRKHVEANGEVDANEHKRHRESRD